MADAAEVVAHALTLPNLTVMALVPNLRGAEAANRRRRAQDHPAGVGQRAHSARQR